MIINRLKITSFSIKKLLTIACLLFTFSSIAQKQQENEKKWDFTVAPYILFPNMNGNVAMANIPIDVSANTGDIFSHLDFGAMLYFEASNDKWAITFDVLYMDLSKEGETSLLNRKVKVGTSQLGITVNGLYRITHWAEIGIGARINSIGSEFNITAAEIVLPGADLSMNQTWFDPLIVARFMTRFDESKWRLGMLVDIGGFGLGSDFAWQVYPFSGYQFSDLFEIDIAWRWLGMNYETGSGTEHFLYDIITSGPEIGFLFHF